MYVEMWKKMKNLWNKVFSSEFGLLCFFLFLKVFGLSVDFWNGWVGWVFVISRYILLFFVWYIYGNVGKD